MSIILEERFPQGEPMPDEYPGLITSDELTRRCAALFRCHRPLAFGGKVVVRWKDFAGQSHEDKLAVSMHALPADPDLLAVVVALVTHFRPGEWVPLKLIAPLCGKDTDNGSFQRKLSAAAAEGLWIVSNKSLGFKLAHHPDP